MIAVGVLTAVTFAFAPGSPAVAAPAAESGGGHAAVNAAALPWAFPGCSWPLETTPSKVNVAAPDPYATYWTTPFIASAGNSLTIKGSFPTSRFMSFTVYNDSFQDFTNTVDGNSVPSDLSDYQIAPDQGSKNPWRTGRLGHAMNFTVRVIPGATNYLAESPYPVVEIGHGANAIFGGTPDFLTTLDDGYYTVVSSLPSDKPSSPSLTANDATWIPTSASHPGTPELQILRNMLSQQTPYPEGFTFISPPASPSDIIAPATVQKQMGTYYPQTAQCTVQTFETQGWTGCLAASTG